jgi:TolA-binding protein
MNITRGAVGLVCLIGTLVVSGSVVAQRTPEVRRAQPVDEPPVEATATPRRANENPPEASPAEGESPAQRQLDYANALFARKLYDLAVPEYQKYVDQFPSAAGRANAYFCLGECYRALNKEKLARTNFQIVLDKFSESEFAGRAAFLVAEPHFTQKEYGAALPLFHRAAAKLKEPSLALSARYYEARCLEALNRKDEARDLYLQVIDAKNPNPYREDSRTTVASMLLANGRKIEAFKQYEALAGETQKAPLKAEATVRAGLIALELQQTENGKIDNAMGEKAVTLLQKGRSLPEAGRWRPIAQAALLRLEYQSGQFAQLLADYKRTVDQLPEDMRPEVMLSAANAERTLGHVDEAERIYLQIIEKYPRREEAKEAQYQRLINLYNSNSPALLSEVDQFVTANPTGERADQARFLKAESYYKAQNFTEAAPIYTALRASQLSPKLRAESAYKLGWCNVQMKNVDGAIEALSYFLKAFPDNSQVPAALIQRSLCYQGMKNYDAALTDLNWLLANCPRVRERESALNQKGLILGQQNDARGMTEAFRQLLKEFPKSQWAADANYFIGKAAFESKDYKAAVPALDAARKLNKEQYYNAATVGILLSFFYLRDRAALTKEVDGFLAAGPTAKVPPEILESLGLDFYNEKNYPAAEKYLGALGQSDNLGNVKPDFWFYLGDTESKLKNFAGAEAALEKYVQVATDPAAKAKALLALGSAKISAHKPDDAQKIAEEIMSLQPEGRVNGEARLLAGDVQIERAHFEEAGKAFLGVALLYDDPTITPRALEKAAFAFTKAGKKEEADRLSKQLHDKYPGYVGG